MDFILEFLRILILVLAYMAPIVLTLAGLISFVGMRIGRAEGWTRIDSLYYAWITATTVGYGDIRPRKKKSKLLAILIAVMGLLLTGIIVAAGIEAVTAAFELTHDTAQIRLNENLPN